MVVMLCGAMFLSYIIGSVAAIMNAGSFEVRRSAAYRAKVPW